MWEQVANFWSVRDAWAAAVEQRQAQAAPALKRRRPTLDGQRRKWTLNADKYLANVKKSSRNPNAAVVAPDTSPEVARLLSALPAALAEELDSRMSSVAFAAFREWPVDSGFSKASLFVSVEPQGETFSLRIGDSAPYVNFIRGAPARKLIGTPARAAAAEGIVAALRRTNG